MLQKTCWLCILALLITGCAQKPLPQEELPPVPETWSQLPEADSRQALSSDWWLNFEADELTLLIQQALEGNPDLAMAYQRKRQAEARWGVSRADSLPQVQGTASAGVNQRSSSAAGSQTTENASLGLSTSYEVDLWGRVAAARRAGEAGFQASFYDWQAARISLLIRVADEWFLWLTLHERLELAEAVLSKREEQLHLVQVQRDLGSVGEEALISQQNLVRSQQQLRDQLDLQYRTSHQALALLLGVPAQALEVPAKRLMQVALPYPEAGLPAELITRRPDLASTEARLEAGAANIEIARKAFLPGMQLGASASLASSSLAFSEPVSTLGLTASLSQMIFDGGRRQQQVELAEAQQLELLASYRGQLLNALSEAETALQRLSSQQKQAARQQALSEAQQELLRLATSRYRLGSQAYSQLLDAEIGWLQQQDAELQERQLLLQRLLEVYLALGGGWESSQAQVN